MCCRIFNCFTLSNGTLKVGEFCEGFSLIVLGFLRMKKLSSVLFGAYLKRAAKEVFGRYYGQKSVFIRVYS